MKIPIEAPRLGLVEQVSVIQWLHKDGDQVAADAPLVVIETSKVEVEVNSPSEGVLMIVVPAGSDNVPADAVLGYVLRDSDDDS